MTRTAPTTSGASPAAASTARARSRTTGTASSAARPGNTTSSWANTTCTSSRSSRPISTTTTPPCAARSRISCASGSSSAWTLPPGRHRLYLEGARPPGRIAPQAGGERAQKVRERAESARLPALLSPEHGGYDCCIIGEADNVPLSKALDFLTDGEMDLMFTFDHMRADCVGTDFLPPRLLREALQARALGLAGGPARPGLERAVSREPRPRPRHKPLRQRGLPRRERQGPGRRVYAAPGHGPSYTRARSSA